MKFSKKVKKLTESEDDRKLRERKEHLISLLDDSIKASEDELVKGKIAIKKAADVFFHSPQYKTEISEGFFSGVKKKTVKVKDKNGFYSPDYKVYTSSNLKAAFNESENIKAKDFFAIGFDKGADKDDAELREALKVKDDGKMVEEGKNLVRIAENVKKYKDNKGYLKKENEKERLAVIYVYNQFLQEIRNNIKYYDTLKEGQLKRIEQVIGGIESLNKEDGIGSLFSLAKPPCPVVSDLPAGEKVVHDIPDLPVEEESLESFLSSDMEEEQKEKMDSPFIEEIRGGVKGKVETQKLNELAEKVLTDLRENGVYSDIFKSDKNKMVLKDLLFKLADKSFESFVWLSDDDKKNRHTARQILCDICEILTKLPGYKSGIAVKLEDVIDSVGNIPQNAPGESSKQGLLESAIDNAIKGIHTFDLSDPDTKEIYDNMRQAHDVIKKSKSDTGLSEGIKDAGSKFLSSVSSPEDKGKANAFKTSLDGLKDKTADKAKKGWIRKFCSWIKDKFLMARDAKNKVQSPKKSQATKYQSRKIKEYANLAEKLAGSHKAGITSQFASVKRKDSDAGPKQEKRRSSKLG